MADNTSFDNDDNVFETLGFDNGDEVSSSGPDPNDIEKITIAQIIRSWDEAPNNAKAEQTGNNQSGNPVPTPPSSPASQGPSSPGQASGNNGTQSPSSKKPKSPKKSTGSVGNTDTGNNSSFKQKMPKTNPFATGKNKMPFPIKYSNNNSGSGNQMYKMAGRMHRMHLNNYGNNNYANNNFFPSGCNGPRPTGSHCNQNNSYSNQNNSHSYQNNSHSYQNNYSQNKSSQNNN
ncbi:unnamed protein product, partial [Rotaria magnacalcarata]